MYELLTVFTDKIYFLDEGHLSKNLQESKG